MPLKKLALASLLLLGAVSAQDPGPTGINGEITTPPQKTPEKDPRDVRIEQLTAQLEQWKKLAQAYQNKYFTCEDRVIMLETFPPKADTKP